MSGVEKRPLEDKDDSGSKKLKLEVNKYIIIPVSSIGCGKTTIGLTLKALFNNWDHIQNDDLPEDHQTFEKAIIKSLESANVVFADRNNHYLNQRKELVDNLESLKDQSWNLHYILLNFFSNKKHIVQDVSLWELTQKRVMNRKNGHQVMRTNGKFQKEQAEEYMIDILNNFENFDSKAETVFSNVVDLDVANNESSRTNIDLILDFFKEKYPKLISEIPDTKKINESFQEALNYAPTVRKVWVKKNHLPIVFTPRVHKKRNQAVGETDVGITKYVSPNQCGFAGAFKERYNDFLVNEIGLDGNVVHLVDEGFPNSKDRKKARQLQRHEEQKKRQDEDKTVGDTKTEETKVPKPKVELTEEQKTQVIEVLGEEDFEKIMNLANSSTKPITTTKKFTEKSGRTKLHQLLRSVFNNKLESITNEDSTIKIAVGTGNNSRGNRNNKEQPVNAGEASYGLGPKKPFLHFVLYKQNKDTMEAVNLMSKFTRINNKSFHYAGTKDRRAVTVQKLCLPNIEASRINSLNKVLKGLKLGGFEYSDTELNLGDLQGNEFVITLRDVKKVSDNNQAKLEKIIEENVNGLKNNGFLNYFGMQRFGTFSISTHTVGKEILLSNWKQTCELLLSNQELVLPDSIQAREIWEATKNPTYALEFMPKKCAAEYCILKFLHDEYQKTKDLNFKDSVYFSAIMKIPRNLRIMYGHAYQSYIWNSVASKRFELFGLNVVEGDLVIENEGDADNLDNEEIFEGGEDTYKPKIIRARPITKQEIIDKKFTIYDVILPTPGFDIVYPENPELKQVYVDIMGQDNLDPFSMARNVRDFSFPGSYRHVVSKPKALEYRACHYENLEDELVADDLKILQDKKMEILKNGGGDYKDPKPVFDESKRWLPEPKGSKLAVVIKMQLGVSAYATMALRELMKLDTTRRTDNFNN